MLTSYLCPFRTPPPFFFKGLSFIVPLFAFSLLPSIFWFDSLQLVNAFLLILFLNHSHTSFFFIYATLSPVLFSSLSPPPPPPPSSFTLHSLPPPPTSSILFILFLSPPAYHHRHSHRILIFFFFLNFFLQISSSSPPPPLFCQQLLPLTIIVLVCRHPLSPQSQPRRFLPPL